VLVVLYTLNFGRRVPGNYWNVSPQSMTLEWTLPSPPPFHQFDIQPMIK
jgi:cytochrome c oxidase subunit 1